MKKISLLLAAVATLAFASCEKQQYDIYTTLTGFVVSAIDSEPLAGATVTVSPGGKSYTTGSNGAFEFPDMEAKQYTLTAQKNGYQSNRTTIAGVAGETVSVTITLTPAAQ